MSLAWIGLAVRSKADETSYVNAVCGDCEGTLYLMTVVIKTIEIIKP